MQVQPVVSQEKNEIRVGEGLPLRAQIRLQGLNPWKNLAREEALWEILPPGALWLVTYVNSPCVVMGKHQNPLREVRLAELARRKVPLLRRLSGGGTVWHDHGNLNFSFLASKEVYDRAAIQDFLVATLGRLGFFVQVGDKGDLLVQGKKISGNAYAFRKDKVLHHGTLLCSASLDELRAVLGPTGELLEWVGVSSRPMSVVNLTEVEPKDRGSVRDADRALSEGHAATFGGRDLEKEEYETHPGFSTAFQSAFERLQSPAWLWGQTPRFEWRGDTLWGTQTVRVADGVVVSAEGPGSGESLGREFFSGAVLKEMP